MVISARPDSDKTVAAGGMAPKEMTEAPGQTEAEPTQGYYVFALPEGSR